ncbi:MAG: helix-turn-helix domain-containing protein [Gammaproteobacteria bacterium]|nr:helix-turn-helix domain-containing protein [Gammaproteobacteria bacterium]
MYKYTECGLRNIQLRNGYEIYHTEHGESVGIHDVYGLHKIIGLHIVNNKPNITGTEIRFLRKELGLSQVEFAQILGVSEPSVRNWEKSRGKFTKPAERLLRLLYREHVSENGIVRELIDRVSKINRDNYQKVLELEETDSGWGQVA